MTKSEFVKSLVEKSGQNKKTIDSVLSSIDEIVREQLSSSQNVPFMTLGTFKINTRKPREARNPVTGETIQVPEKTVVKFGVSKSLKELIADKFAK
jgi:DNA-binding protein HU-beta